MALLFCDNFENWSSTSSNNPGPWTFWQTTLGVGTGSTSANVNFTTPGCYQGEVSTSFATWLALGFQTSSTVIINTRLSFRNGGPNDNGSSLWLVDGGTEQCSLRIQPDGKFAVYRGLSTAKLGESINSFPINANEFMDVELKVNIHNTTGTVELRVNGVVEISLINQNTRASANNSCNSIRIGKTSSSQVGVPVVKQFILMDTTGSVMNDFIGPVDVTSLRPNADGEYDDWTANTGTRFAAVNQAVTDGDTTFVSSSTPGDQVTFQLGNLPSGVTDVFAVFPQMQIRREQGTTRICKFLMRSGIDDELGAKELAIGPTYAFRQEAITTSPFTTNAWDVAEVNGLELGVEITT
jgi:hypothetical protein